MKQNEELIIDVDIVIDNYNKKNQKLKQMNRKSLAVELGVNVQVFSDWKNGKTPKLIQRLFQMKSIGKCGIEDFVKPKK
tara:strand:+ start:521 stop:757 length:237 start_codon:yes stop_codon:yes gene_type:complete